MVAASWGVGGPSCSPQAAAAAVHGLDQLLPLVLDYFDALRPTSPTLVRCFRSWCRWSPRTPSACLHDLFTSAVDSSPDFHLPDMIYQFAVACLHMLPTHPPSISCVVSAAGGGGHTRCCVPAAMLYHVCS